jgi:succinate dehydrogenase / fumarate reductase flavoprotein subunit
LLSVKGKETVREIHMRLGHIMMDKVGMSRTEEGLKDTLEKIPGLREEFWQNVNVPGSGDDLNKSLEQANRLADFLELGELMARDALQREESCGGHFREEYQTPEGEALRNDKYQGPDKPPVMHKEELEFERVTPSQRSYK